MTQLFFVLIVFLVIFFLQYQDLFTCNSNRQLLQNYRHYCFINYLGFLIANSPYFPPGKNRFHSFNFRPIQRSKMLSFRGSEGSPLPLPPVYCLHTSNKIFATLNWVCRELETITVKRLYSGHHRDIKIVSIIQRCLLHRGSSQIGLFCFENLLQGVSIECR